MLGITLSRCVCVRRISLGGEGNALYPVLSSYDIKLIKSRDTKLLCCMDNLHYLYIKTRLSHRPIALHKGVACDSRGPPGPRVNKVKTTRSEATCRLVVYYTHMKIDSKTLEYNASG